jgi:hypothetical protein
MKTVEQIKELHRKASPIQDRDFLVLDMLKAEADLQDNAYQYIGILLTEIKNLEEEISNYQNLETDGDRLIRDFHSLPEIKQMYLNFGETD